MLSSNVIAATKQSYFGDDAPVTVIPRGLVGQSGYTAAARAMDDHNNYAGAALGADSRYANMSTTELADFAFARGCVVKAP